jgi:hypothetical protein
MEMEGLHGILDRIQQVEAAGGDQLTQAARSSADASTDLGSRRTLLLGPILAGTASHAQPGWIPRSGAHQSSHQA